ncbi:MAG: hypothetical protein M3Z01_02180 [Thermoproteota archaeon]|nr:hypothetical protein [Thermoproteota archaeon]
MKDGMEKYESFFVNSYNYEREQHGGIKGMTHQQREVHEMFNPTDIDTLKQDKRCQPCWYIVLSTMSGITTIKSFLRFALILKLVVEIYSLGIISSTNRTAILLLVFMESLTILFI